MKKALFIDRDGVINRSIVRSGKPYAPTRLADLEILEGVPQALDALHAAGWMIVIVTNQPDIATGKQTLDGLELIHAKIQAQCAIDAIVVCPHADADHCSCRKPKPGMLIKAALELGIDLSQSYMIGDRWRDIACGQAAGCKGNFWINYGYLEALPEQPYLEVKSLAECVNFILALSISKSKNPN